MGKKTKQERRLTMDDQIKANIIKDNIFDSVNIFHAIVCLC